MAGVVIFLRYNTGTQLLVLNSTSDPLVRRRVPRASGVFHVNLAVGSAMIESWRRRHDCLHASRPRGHSKLIVVIVLLTRHPGPLRKAENILNMNLNLTNTRNSLNNCYLSFLDPIIP